MDPFTQRMLERARARQEKIDHKLASSGQTPKRKPLTENIAVLKTETPMKSPLKPNRTSILSPKKSSLKSESPIRSPNRKSLQKSDQTASPQRKNDFIVTKKDQGASPQRKNDFIVTKKEYKNPKRGSDSRRGSDVSVEINIMHREDVQIEVQVEERDAPMSIIYDSSTNSGSNVTVKEIHEDKSRQLMDREHSDMEHQRSDRGGLRHNVKSRLDRLGILYSDKPDLSSPIHRTELEFTSATPPSEYVHHQDTPRPEPNKDGRRKFGRLAALADTINNWEDDLTHHVAPNPDACKKTTALEEAETSTLEVSIHSLQDIDKVLSSVGKSKKEGSKPVNSTTYSKPSNGAQRLDKKIVAELEGEGYRRVSAGQSRLVYDFSTTKTSDRDRQEPSATTPSADSAPNMATMVASNPPPAIAKKPSIKKYKAPTPPRNVEENSESDKDKENNVVQREENDNDAAESCVQTKPEPEGKAPEKGSPVVKRLAPKLNGNADRNSVLSKAAMFEAGSPKARDPAEMSLRERKALFEKNKGAAIIPKAPFGMAPSVKTLHGVNNKADSKATRQISTHQSSPVKSNSSSKTSSKENIPDDSVSQNSYGGGIKGKLAALFSKEQTISETTIANKFKLEREKEMEMLQNRFHFKPEANAPKPGHDPHDSEDEDPSEHDPSEDAPLMGSTVSLNQGLKKPEIIANIPKVKSSSALQDEEVNKDVVAAQPVKRRSSQDSQVVLSVLDDVKRIKVNAKKEPQTNGAVTAQPNSLYPHLSDIETDTSHTQEEYSDCGGSSEDNLTDKLNKSDNWAETSFGRDVMNVVKKNNSSYKKAMRDSDCDTSNSDMNSELDDMLDEALDDAESEGPTPPKLNKNGNNSLSSKSFTYEDGTQQRQFKSPLKVACPPSCDVTPRSDRGAELVHSVSFYRRMQNATRPACNLSTPLRQIRHASPERDIPATPDEPAVSAMTVRQRIKELQGEINKQQTVISQASQALNLCASTVEFSGSTEQAEGERLLLLATHRRQACLHEMQRLQVEGAGPAGTAGMASLHMQGLSVPLRRDYMRQLNADGAVGHHAVCLLKCRDRVLASSMQLTSPTTNVLHFPDEIRMDGLASDFKVTIEVYLLQASKELLPHDVKYHIFKKSGSKLLTPKSKVSELKAPKIQSPGGPLSVRSPQFQPHGYCIFALQQATRSTFTLNKVPHGSPLDGSINLNIKARVRVPPPPPHSAFLTAFDDVSGLGAWHRRWFLLQPPRLSYWKYPDDVHKKMPIGDIDLTTVISDRVTKAPRDLCARPNTLLLESSVPPGLIVPDSGSLVYVKRGDGSIIRRHLLAADTQTDRDVWLEALNKALEYVRCCQSNDG